eukprot:GHVU01044138.1.p5 GENE.GHVU01044138.1~~GHVU01044138.1.p5  ORF type:complete len:106 (+),score=11.26 GHVU01044138.1:1925-2242(+)
MSEAASLPIAQIMIPAAQRISADDLSKREGHLQDDYKLVPRGRVVLEMIEKYANVPERVAEHYIAQVRLGATGSTIDTCAALLDRQSRRGARRIATLAPVFPRKR